MFHILDRHSLVLTSNGEVYSFGDNSYGQLCRNLSANLTYTNETGLINMTSLSGTIVKIGGSSFASYFLSKFSIFFIRTK